MDPIQAGKSVINFLDVHPWILITLIAHGAILGAVAYLILLERKIASWVQDRIGPNRVGLGFGIIPWLKDKKMMGLGQPLADGVKFILKEDYRPKGADKWLFTAAPMMMIIVVILSIAVLPWGGIKQTTRDIDVTSWIAGEPDDAGRKYWKPPSSSASRRNCRSTARSPPKRIQSKINWIPTASGVNTKSSPSPIAIISKPPA